MKSHYVLSKIFKELTMKLPYHGFLRVFLKIIDLHTIICTDMLCREYGKIMPFNSTCRKKDNIPKKSSVLSRIVVAVCLSASSNIKINVRN